MGSTSELLNSTNSPHMRIALLLCITEKKITRLDTSIPSKQWNIPIKLSNGRKKLIENLKSQPESHKGTRSPRRNNATYAT